MLSTSFKKINLTSFLLFTLLVLLCQGCSTIYSGQVVSELDGSPIENVHVVLQNADCSPSVVVSAVTDKNGNFQLHIPFILRSCVKKNANVSLTKEKYKQMFGVIEKLKENTVIKMSPE